MKIYKITCTINQKCYIGQTTRTVRSRFRNHIRASRLKREEGNKFYRAIRKHGEENFIYEELCSCKSLDELDDKECFYINIFDSIKNGYNTCNGGRTNRMTDEIKLKISRANKGRRITEEMKAKISKANKGHSRNLGFKHSEETKLKQSKMRKGKIITVEARLKASKTLKGTRTGADNPFFGKKHTDETKAKLKAKRANQTPNRKITDDQMVIIKKVLLEGGNQSELAKRLNISIARISQIKIEFGWVKLKGDRS